MKRGVEVFSHDPYVKQDVGGKFSNDIREAVHNADALVIVTDHDDYKKLDLSSLKPLLKDGAVVVDGRRIFSPEEIEKLGLKYYGIGC